MAKKSPITVAATSTLEDGVARVERESEREIILQETEDRKTAAECWLITDPKWGGCCCICDHRLQDYSHPHTDGGSILHRRGFACVLAEMGGLFSGWMPHGFCECFELRSSLKSQR
jgi:hypothetical protein